MAVPSPSDLRSLDDICDWVKANCLTEIANSVFLEIMGKLHADYAKKYPGESVVIKIGSGYLDTKDHGVRRAYFLILQTLAGADRTRLALVIDETGEKFEQAMIVPDHIVETQMQ